MKTRRKYIFLFILLLVPFCLNAKGLDLGEKIGESKNALLEYIDKELTRNAKYKEQLFELKKEANKDSPAVSSRKSSSQLRKLDKQVSSFNQEFCDYIDNELSRAIKYEKKLLQLKEDYLRGSKNTESFIFKPAVKTEDATADKKPSHSEQKALLSIESGQGDKDGVVKQKAKKADNTDVMHLALRSYEEGLAESVFQKEATVKREQLIGIKDSSFMREAREFKEGVVGLKEAIKIAYRYSPELKYSQANMESALAKTKEAARALWPFLYVEMSQAEGDLLEGVEFEEKKYGLSFEHTIYSSGHLGAVYEQAKKQYRAAEAKHRKAQADLYLKVAQAYYELVKTVLTYKIQGVLVQEVKEDLDVSQEKFSQGLVTEEELMEVRTRFNQVDFQRLSAERDVVLARYKFIQVLGITKEEDAVQVKNIDTTLDFEGIEVTLDDIFDLALEKRIELQVAQLMIQISEDEKKIAKSKDDLKIDISGFVGRSASYYVTEDENYQDDWSIVLKVTKSFGPNSMNYNYTNADTSPKLGQSSRTKTSEQMVKVGIFDNFEQNARIKKAQADYQQSLKEFADVKKEVGMEAHQAYFDYGEAALRVRNSIERIKLAQQRLSTSQYQMGLNQIPLSQVIDAKIKLADEKSLYVQALADYKISLYKLDHAVGQWGKFSYDKANYGG